MSDRAFSEGLDRYLTTEPEEIPLDEETPAVIEARDAAEEAAEAIRTLNHLTLPANGAPGLEFPADAHVIIGDLRTVTLRLPQLLTQLAEWLIAEHRSGRVGVDAPHLDAGLEVAKCCDGINSAIGAAQGLERHLRWAHETSGRLTGTPDGA